MRRNTIILLFLFIIPVVLVLGSCAKKQSPQTPFTRLIGKWKKAKYATDDNNNGLIDASEISPVPAAIDDELFFKSDGSGVETTVVNKEASSPLNFDWKIVNGDSIIVAYTANDTITYYLDGVSSVDLTLETETNQGLAWYYYIKQ